MFEHKCNEWYEPVRTHTQTCALIYLQIHIGFVYCAKAHSHSCAKDETTFSKHSRQVGGNGFIYFLRSTCSPRNGSCCCPDHACVIQLHVRSETILRPRIICRNRWNMWWSCTSRVYTHRKISTLPTIPPRWLNIGRFNTMWRRSSGCSRCHRIVGMWGQ